MLAAAAVRSRLMKDVYSSVRYTSIKSHHCYTSKTVKTISSGDLQETMPILKLAFLLMCFENSDFSVSIIIIAIILMWFETEKA